MEYSSSSPRVLPSSDSWAELLVVFDCLALAESTSGLHMPSETDVWGVRGHKDPLMQIKEETWRATEMNKPLKWLQREREDRHQSGVFVCACWYGGHLHVLKPELQTRLNYYCWIWFWVVWNKHTQDAVLFRCRYASCSESLFPPLSFYPAQTCFSLPPLNSLLSERDQRSGTLTCPEGGWRTPHLPPLHERCAVPPISLFCIHLSLLSSLGSPDSVQKELCIWFLPLFWILRMDQ